MILILVPLLLLAAALPAQAKDKDKREEIEDPYILQEMRKAESSNLDNALETSRAKSEEAAELLRGLMAVAKAQADSLLSDVSRSIDGERTDPDLAGRAGLAGELEELSLSAQMLPLKAEAFEKAAKAAGIKLARSGKQDILGAGRSYRSEDRARDLKRAEAYVQQAAKRLKRKAPPALDNSQEAFLKTGEDFQGELDHCVSLARTIRGRLEAAGLGKGALAKKMDFWLKTLDKSSKDVSNERRFLKAGLTLVRSDEEDF